MKKNFNVRIQTITSWKYLVMVSLIVISLFDASNIFCQTPKQYNQKEEFNLSEQQKNLILKLQKVEPELKIKWDSVLTVPTSIKGTITPSTEKTPMVVAKEFINNYQGLFKAKNIEKDIKVSEEWTDNYGFAHISFQQYFKEILVRDGNLTLHFDKQNRVKRVVGTIYPISDFSTKPKLSKEQAYKIALQHAEAPEDTKSEENPSLELRIKRSKYYLCWKFVFPGTVNPVSPIKSEEKQPEKGSGIPAIWQYWVDAHTGAIIDKEHNIRFDLNPTVCRGVGVLGNARNLRTVQDTQTGTSYLRDRSRPMYSSATENGEIQTRVYTSHRIILGGIVIIDSDISSDNDCNWNAPTQDAAVDAHHYTGVVYEYYRGTHCRNSWDDDGASMVSIVDIPLTIFGANAWWDGAKMNYAVGGPRGGVQWRDASVALDIVAHELTHAVTDNEANLEYKWATGAINESISDVFACLIEGDWLIGEDWVIAGRPGGVIRSLVDPTLGGIYDPANPFGGGQPDHMDQWPTVLGDPNVDPANQNNDNGWVHLNSGIPNKAAFLIAVGGTHRGITTFGIGNFRTGKIYYYMVQNYLRTSYPDNSFEEFREDLEAAAETLFPEDEQAWIRATVSNAFAAVGVGNSVPKITPPTESEMRGPWIFSANPSNLPNPSCGVEVTLLGSGFDATCKVSLVEYYNPAVNLPGGGFFPTATIGSPNWPWTPIQSSSGEGIIYDVQVLGNGQIRFKFDGQRTGTWDMFTSRFGFMVRNSEGQSDIVGVGFVNLSISP